MDIEELKNELLKKIEQVIEEVLREYTKPKTSFTPIKEFIEIEDKKYKIVISPTKQLDKIIVYLYKAGKKLDIIGEVISKNGDIQFYPYLNKLKKLAYKERFVVNEMVAHIIDIINKYVDRIKEFVEKGAKIRNYDEVIKKEEKEESYYEELPENIGERIRLIEEEMKQYLDETGKEYVPESIVKRLLNKYKVKKSDFIRFVTEFYEKEKGKWYPL